MDNVAPEPKPNAIPIVMCTIAWRDKLLDHALNVARKLAFSGVEIWGREPHTPEKFDETRMRATKRLLESTGVAPTALGSYLRFGATRNNGEVQLSDVLLVARWLKTPLIRVWASDVSARNARPEVWHRAIAEAREACDRAAKLDMTLAVEMHAGTLTDTAPATVRFVEEVAKPNCKVNFQIASFDDGQAPEERLAAVMPYVAHVHAQNYERIPLHESDPVRRVPLSSGVVSYPRLVGQLKQAGYAGAIAVEFAYDESGDKQKALFEDLRFLQTLCA